MNFLCNDSVSVASIKRNNENIMICGFFVYNQSKFGIVLKSKFDKTDFDQNSLVVLIQLTVVLYWEIRVLSSGFLNTQSWYEQSLLGTDQSGKDLNKITVKIYL